MRDEPNVRLRCSWNFQKKKSLVLPMKNTRLTTTSYPLPFSLHLVYIQNVPVYAGTTRTCWKHMCAWCRQTRGFQRVTHHTTLHTTTTTRPPHHTETDTERERQREKRRRKRRRQENRREKREVRRFFLQCGGAWPFFVGVVIFWLIPFARDTVAC